MSAGRNQPPARGDGPAEQFAGGPVRADRAFTLVELLVVMAIIVLLVGMLFPSLRAAREQVLAANCQSNLKHVVDAIQGTSAESGGSLPLPTSWISWVVKRQASAMLVCPKDTDLHGRPTSSGLAQMYILHQHSPTQWFYDYLTDMMQGGGDFQAHYLSPGNYGPPAQPEEVNWNWLITQVPGDLRDNQVAFTIDNDCAILVTSADNTEFRSLQGQIASMGSEHYFCKGEGGPGWASQVLMRLWGNTYHTIDPRSPIIMPGCGLSSYGMNNQVPQKTSRLDQLLLMDSNSSVVDFDGLGNHIDDDDVIAPRHMGKANVVSVDGSVRAMTLGDLQWELEKPNGIWKP